MTAPVHRARSWASRLLPYAIAVVSLPFLGPTCGGQLPGQKAFSRSALIIPMDGCYQFATDGSGQSASRAGCGTATSDAGDVIKAYGLVYQLVRAGVPVYWVISPDKTSATGVDVTVSYTGGAPVLKYNWSDPNGAGGSQPANNPGSTFRYVGGPFVVDGSDYAAANAVLQSFKATYSVVNVHVAQVAFQGNAAKVFSGGWNAGGAVAPKLALLNIPGGDGRYADHVLEGYLVKSGLAPACVLANPPCADSSAGTATGTHGNIYDRLEAADFLPPACTSSAQCNTAAGSTCGANGFCDWKSTNVYRGGYKVLWLPHWTGSNSCEGTLGAGYTCGTGFGGCSFAGGDTCSCVNNCTANLSAAELSRVLQTIGGFQAGGNDVFGECGGIGTLEGTYNTGTATVTASFGPGDAASRFMTTGTGTFPSGGGVWINEDWSGGTPPTTAFATSWFPSPFLQIGDFPFRAQTGLIQSYRAAQANGSAAFRSTVVHLIAEPAGNQVDIFSLLPAAGGAGNAVYLAGHDYSGFQGAYQIAGTRLVLNTLFNLSATCQPSGAACQQLKNFGTCRPGTMQCCSAADIAMGYCQVEGEPVCRPALDPPGTPETCNGLDDNCDGIVDNIPATDTHVSSPGCYDGPPATVNPGTGKPYGTCQQGVWSCQQTGTPQSPSATWACIGEVLPVPEACNGLDDDCNGTVDDSLTPPGGTLACFTGPPDAVMQSSFPPSQCKPGTWACQGASWVCNGQQLPQQEICEGTLRDYNCNGIVGDGCQCVVGTARTCYTGPAGTAGHGICRTGTQSCVQDPAFPTGQGTWTNVSCSDQVLPQAEICRNGLDDDCNGIIDDPAQCSECQPGQTRKCYPAGSAGCTGSPGGPYACQGVCAAGDEVCVGGKWSGACSGAIIPGPELCDGKDNTCSGALDETNAPCPGTLACLNGVCTQPTWGGESDCMPGYVHSGGGTSGTCVAQSCPTVPCPAGQLCQGGTTCLDPCAGTTCGEGAFCSIGVSGQPECVGGGCSATGCTGTDVCRNGTCQADVCAGVACPAGTFCRGNYALATPTWDCVRACAAVTCPAGQACGPDGFCAPDPCASATCPSGQVCRASGTSTSCIADPCPPGVCGAGQACVDGRCTDDPCAGVVCPAGVCARGQCYASNNLNGYGPTPAAAAGKAGGGGCGCGGGDSGPTALLLALLALPFAGRRRGRAPRRRGALGGAAALVLAGFLASGAGCSKGKTSPLNCETCGTDHCVDVKFDAAHCSACASACAAGDVCVDSVCITASAAVPSITSVSPAPVAAHTSPTFTVAGDRFQAGAVLRVSGAGLAAVAVPTTFVSSAQITASVDLSSALPGTLSLQVANPDHTTSNTTSVEVVTPTPVIASVTPSSAVAGSSVAVHVAGSGFTPAAICVQRDTRSGASIAIPPASTPTGTALDCTLDLSAVPPGTIQVVVQNENLVESAPFPFDVGTATPLVSSLSPNPAQQGSEIRLVVSGTGFVPNSVVQIGQGGTYGDLLTAFAASTLLQAQLSLAAFAAGTYQVRVVNPGVAAPSAAVDLVVAPGAPVATGLTVTPTSPRLGDTGVALALTGSGFTGSCQVEVLRAGGATWLGPPDVVTGAGTTAGAIQAATDMAGSDGTWYARVSCPGGCASPPCLTSAFPFQVATNVASLAGTTPAGGSQGTTVPVTVTGSNFVAGMKLRLSGAPDVAATLDPTTPSSKATASLPLAGLDVGSHLLQAVNTGAAASNGIAFSVTPGVPSISGTTTADYCPGTPPACNGACTPSANCSAACAVQQAKPVTVTISGSNFAAGLSTVFATSALGKIDVATIPGCTVTVASASTITMTLDTTQVVAPMSYTVSVENPGNPPPGGWPTTPYRVSTTTCP
ncbi:MAG TPA: putative metal-binding motif-containing protein [Anaeromyxobacteraceae bacterium]|nr:putative metal-binding motif-containing protein [Anaeromyxobacteraceae bacterium]